MSQAESTAPRTDVHNFVKSVHGIRYQVKDVARSVAFYTEQLGFKLEHQQLPAFATVSLCEASVLLSGPAASIDDWMESLRAGARSGVKHLATRQHLNEARDALGACLGLLRFLHPVDHRVPIVAVEPAEEGECIGLGIERAL
jgi:catechol 2,3-dioxygenase-like lactoylglutathione lyase family enzyme